MITIIVFSILAVMLTIGILFFMYPDVMGPIFVGIYGVVVIGGGFYWLVNNGLKGLFDIAWCGSGGC